MDKQIIAIGGGGLEEIRNGVIEKYILDQSNSNSPNVYFIPTILEMMNHIVVTTQR